MGKGQRQALHKTNVRGGPGVVTDWCLAIHACSLTEWCLGRRVGTWGRGVLADSLNSNSQ